jgi:hypothetical protein
MRVFGAGARSESPEFGFALWFDQEHLYLFLGSWAVHNTSRHNERFAGLDGPRWLALDIHKHLTLRNEEKVIRRIVFMKRVFTNQFHNHDFILIIVSSGPGGQRDQGLTLTRHKSMLDHAMEQAAAELRQAVGTPDVWPRIWRAGDLA